MASEKTKKNRATQLVYWVIGAVALAGVILMFSPQEDTHTKLTGNLVLSSDSMEIVNTYLQWTNEASRSDMHLNHSFAANGLNKMADALKVLSMKVSKRVGLDSKTRIDSIKQMSGLLSADSESTEHAEMIKKAFTASKQVLTLVQTYSFPELKDEIEVLNQKVSVIKPEKLMLEQKTEIVQVFQQVAAILTEMTDDENKKLK